MMMMMMIIIIIIIIIIIVLLLYKSRPRSHFELDRIRFFSSLPPLINPRVGKNKKKKKKRESRAALSS